MNNIYLVTEECITDTQIKFLCNKYFKSINEKISFGQMKFSQESKNIWKISGIKAKSKKDFYILVARGSGSFLDVLLYDEPSIEDLNKKSPKIACEITKNSPKESGNMTSQRLGKWATIQNDQLLKTTQKIYLIDHKKEIKTEDVTNTNDRSFGIMSLFGVDIHFKQIDSEISTVYVPKTKINGLADLNRSGGRVTNKVSVGKNLINIETNFYNNKKKKSGNNDPNTGWISGVVGAIRILDKNIAITIKSNRPTDEILGQNKLSKILNEASAKITFNNIIATAPKQTGDKTYWAPEDTGEKLGSISMEFNLRNQGKKILFSNHAGCEKSYVTSKDGELQQPKKGEGIPDLVYLDGDKIIAIEAEQHQNYKAGIKQVKQKQFKLWIVREFSSYSGKTVEVFVSTNKRGDTRKHVIYDGFGNFQSAKPVYRIQL
tara:strand:- start:401 stop:1696 length:1296 start_codon:yes stop_codon:yes gene_type:complete